MLTGLIGSKTIIFSNPNNKPQTNQPISQLLSKENLKIRTIVFTNGETKTKAEVFYTDTSCRKIVIYDYKGPVKTKYRLCLQEEKFEVETADAAGNFSKSPATFDKALNFLSRVAESIEKIKNDMDPKNSAQKRQEDYLVVEKLKDAAREMLDFRTGPIAKGKSKSIAYNAQKGLSPKGETVAVKAGTGILAVQIAPNNKGGVEKIVFEDKRKDKANQSIKWIFYPQKGLLEEEKGYGEKDYSPCIVTLEEALYLINFLAEFVKYIEKNMDDLMRKKNYTKAAYETSIREILLQVSQRLDKLTVGK